MADTANPTISNADVDAATGVPFDGVSIDNPGTAQAALDPGSGGGSAVSSPAAVALMAMGSALFTDTTGVKRRLDCVYDYTAGKLYLDPNGGTAPTVVYQAAASWRDVNHAGHPFTHLGGYRSSTGNADVWYCQTDNVVCCDTVT